MQTLIAITNTLEERAEIYITDKSQFEEMPLSSTYREYGQSNGRDDAGDYVEILSDELAVNLNEYLLEIDEDNTTYKKGDIISFYDDWDAATWIIENGDKAAYELSEEMCLAYNYWDGSNWATVLLETENGSFDTGWVICENSDEIIKEYLSKEYDSEGFGIKYYKSDNYTFVVSLFESDWSHACILDEQKEMEASKGWYDK